MSTGNVTLSEPANIKGRHIGPLHHPVDTMLIVSTAAFPCCQNSLILLSITNTMCIYNDELFSSRTSGQKRRLRS